MIVGDRRSSAWSQYVVTTSRLRLSFLGVFVSEGIALHVCGRIGAILELLIVDC